MPRTEAQYEEIRESKRSLIKNTALKLFAEQGYDNTSISQIGKTAGISKGLLYNYFESKDDLLQNIMETLSEEFAEIIDPDRDGEVTDEEAVKFLDDFFAMLITRREEFQLYYRLIFQPVVKEFLRTKFDNSRYKNRQLLIFRYFGKRIPAKDERNSLFTVNAFLKGLIWEYIYAPDQFSEEFMTGYKEFLKKMIWSE